MTRFEEPQPGARELTLIVSGMFCAHCRDRVQRALLSVPGVRSAAVDFAHGEARVSFDSGNETIGAMIAAVEAAGYEASAERESPWQTWFQSFSLTVVILSAWVLLEKTGLAAMLAPTSLASGGMSAVSMFMAGLATSAHCVAMCGALALSQSLGSLADLRRPLFYNVGRVVSYTLVGLLLGAVGGMTSAAFSPGAAALVQGALKALAGLCMVALGARMLGLFPALRKVSFFGTRLSRLAARLAHGGAFAVGLVNGLMPCGPLQAAQIASFASGSALSGAAAMFAFALGTVPLMLALGVFAVSLGRRFLRAVSSTGAVLICVLGLSMTAQGGALTGMFGARAVLLYAAVAGAAALCCTLPLKKHDRALAAAACVALGLWAGFRTDESGGAERISSVVRGSAQTVESTLKAGSFPDLSVAAGLPVRWIVHVSEEALNGCNYQVVLPEWSVRHTFVPGENVIEFTPREPGQFPYSCWMGMIRGTVEVRTGHDS